MDSSAMPARRKGKEVTPRPQPGARVVHLLRAAGLLWPASALAASLIAGALIALYLAEEGGHHVAQAGALVVALALSLAALLVAGRRFHARLLSPLVRLETSVARVCQGEPGASLATENVGVLGFTWASPWRIYLSGQVVYRSERYTDRDNTAEGLLRADTTGTVLGFWESADKRIILGAGAGNLGSKARKEVYVVDARLRF